MPHSLWLCCASWARRSFILRAACPLTPLPPPLPSLPSTYHSILVATHGNKDKASSLVNNSRIISPCWSHCNTSDGSNTHSTYLMRMSVDVLVELSGSMWSFMSYIEGRDNLTGDRKKECKTEHVSKLPLLCHLSAQKGQCWNVPKQLL